MNDSQRSRIEAKIAVLDKLRQAALDQLKPGMDRNEERSLVRSVSVYQKEGERLQAQLAQITE
ncbi:hypothetical protein EFK68_03500 [Pseudomonas aeruginosa]|uniref:hypothetical protein n=1 Tax=Pseudomonas aeruginosa TaxID=287 RepID=UPI000F6AD588|nr:hypothetical protein [Pseudomonas aeruginosa]EKF7416813.1 hypothetical protein [Pseudomonas aeruginosa]RNF58455.1 hypothetical protein EFK68_03500 [Pseudomonas aeruginosa]CAI9794846.1 hypothetical protein PAER4782_34675 [Pseudomonas aeruginosa]CAI9912235.1 hypothetical protein PAER4782_34675 [Pseudomonas aeruginosa]HBO1619488.1 hypothetical protein [Pseudomonas aeruginosa]